MSLRFAVLLSAAVATLPLAAAEVNGDAFHLTLPAQFGAAVKSTTTKDNIATDTWVSKAPSGEAVVVSVSQMPAKITDPAKLIDSTRDSLLQSVKGTLEKEEPITGALPARKVVFRSGTAFLRARLTVDGDRLYDVLYVGRSEDQRNAPAVGLIFDSFQITPAPAAADTVTTTTTPAATTTAATTTSH
jgi:hypothetical protein